MLTHAPSWTRCVVIALVLLAVPSTTTAQQCDCAAPVLPVRWSVFASVAGAGMQTATINAHLAPQGYFALSSDAVGFSLGGFTSFGPLRLGVEHVRLDAGEESTPGGRSARLEARYSMFTVGWDLRPRGRLSIAPTLGVGRGSYVVTVGDRSGTAVAPSPPPTFDEILADPGRSSRIGGAQWVFEPMLAADLLVVRSERAGRGITLGLRAGYRVAPNRPDWEYRGKAAAGGPVDQAKGPILRLTFGVGGR
ncbi:MAG: hypothetical protein OEW77_00130 [Gemmatimonadota bacterium]|nr:hypothetical protein [Gemmatimonadota bacterium]